MKNRHLVLLISLLWLLVACGGETSSEPGASVPTAVAPAAIPTTPPTDVLIVGVSADSPPFVDKQAGEIVGFDIDLMNAIAAEAGWQIRYEETRDWGGIFQDLANGRFDIVISAATITPERENVVAFSEPYFNAGLALAVRQDSLAQAVGDLTEQKVGVQQGTTGELWLSQNSQAVIVPFRDADLALTALERGDITAVVHDQLILSTLLKTEPRPTVRLRPTLLTEELYAIAVRPDDPILAQINAGLQAARDSGAYNLLCEKWFGTVETCLSREVTAVVETTAPATQPDPLSDNANPPVDNPSPSPVPATANDIPLVSCVVPQNMAETGRVYQIQAGDSLSTLASRELGNPYDYRAILALTNARCQNDANLTCIDNPSLLQVGWQVYLPTQSELDSYWGNVTQLPPVDFGVAGQIRVTGSSTVYPLTRQMAACFGEQGATTQIELVSTGTGGGLAEFCAGNGDIVDASRPITPEEVAQCQANGREPLAFTIGSDAIALAVSERNTFATALSIDELKQVLATATLWSDVRPGWPSEPIQRFYPTADSGTFDMVAETLFAGDTAVLRNAPNVMLTSEDDLELVAGVQGNPFAVGFFGYAFFKHNAAQLRTLPVGGVQPSPEASDQGAYLLARPLLLYTTADLLQTRPEVRNFINYYLASVKDYVTEVGYFLAQEEDAAVAIRTFNEN